MAVGPATDPAMASRKDQTLGIILGASRFPNLLIDSPRLGSAFAKSKADTKRYLSGICEYILDCFDSKKLPNVLCLEVASFLERYSLATDLIVYYVGHGGFLSTQEYFLAFSATREKQKHATGLRVSDLATTIMGSFRNRRVYLIFDCCFAGSAADSFQAGSDDLIAKQTEKFPTGISLLNASSRNEAAVVPEGGARTMFGECLLEVLRNGILGRGDRLSLREVGSAVSDLVMNKYAEYAVRPEVHSPRQRDGDVADLPLFPNPSFVRQTPKIASTEPGVTAFEISRLYNFPRRLDGKGECIGIVALGGANYKESDLQQYFSSLNLALPSVQRVVVEPRLKEADSGASAHLTFQIELCGAIAPAASFAIYQAANTNDGFLRAIEAATADETRSPTVLLIAWGAPESAWNQQSLRAMERALTAAALRGITVCCASGDNGAVDHVLGNQAEVDFPASSPHVFAVGGTSLKFVDGEHIDEVAWSLSGGGVSSIFPKPEWQKGIHVRPAAGSREDKRAVPDISAHADPNHGYRAFFDGKWTLLGGTTASASVWAGLFALLNQAVGRRPAFTHEKLYKYFGPAGVLRDITLGNNGAGRHPGYDAGVGWDACTGWGAPNGGDLAIAAKVSAYFIDSES